MSVYHGRARLGRAVDEEVILQISLFKKVVGELTFVVWVGKHWAEEEGKWENF